MGIFSRRLGWFVSALLAFAPVSVSAEAVMAMRDARARVAAEDWTGAFEAARGAGDVGVDIVTWQWLRAGGGRLGDYETFLQRHPDWPGLPMLKKKGEEAVARSTDPARVVAYFAGSMPETAPGSLAYIRALQAQGRVVDAENEAFRAWTNLSFSPKEEQELFSLYGDALSVAHEVRLDRLLWQNRFAEAKRMLPRVSLGRQALAEARMALHADLDGVNAMIARIPSALQNDPGLAFERFDWRFRRDRNDDAAEIVIAASKSLQTLGDPEAWSERRASLARALLRDGKPKVAYKVAASNHLSEGSNYADLEFLSGWISLRFLGDPVTALKHFKHLKAAVSTSISVARAYYWQGRALQATGDTGGATTFYRSAAQHQTAYYGLMAAETLGLNLDKNLLSDQRPPAWQGARFTRSSVFAAAVLLEKAGDRALAKRFFLHLSESLSDTEIAQLAQFTLELNEPHLALVVAKEAAKRGVILTRSYYPIPSFVPNDGLVVSRALALAISRRESEFDPAARSAAGARGLMQVLPSTAKLVASRVGLVYDGGRLNDPAYNVQIGAGYLAQLVEQFGPSVALVASSYNAGPGRPKRWMQSFGDPRDPSVDVVDWVEMIPFSETRTYVMRVVESLVIYRAKLKGVTGPVRITSELRG